MIVTPAQICSLFRLRYISVVYDIRSATDHAVIVTSAGGSEWIIETTGRTFHVKGSVS